MLVLCGWSSLVKRPGSNQPAASDQCGVVTLYLCAKILSVNNPASNLRVAATYHWRIFRQCAES